MTATPTTTTDKIETIYAAELRIVDGRLSVEVHPRINIPYAENAAIAVDLLRKGQPCRINASASVLTAVRAGLTPRRGGFA